ncbi:hypothetical protein EYZ11_007390 [Aspergillus tanneri]|uniref:Uncharacterized protein n=1 Tax=Aspergillus tanneri TaxID=1220188 RepID=A0A4S3JFE6_9EURO|nr:hypothetical protein EYZ11_007390 [Aspergillus tanneri]
MAQQALPLDLAIIQREAGPVSKSKTPKTSKGIAAKKPRNITTKGPPTANKQDVVREKARLVTAKSPYTVKFFTDLANTVVQVFPFELFAAAHHCSGSEVSQAVTAVVLSDPSFKWHENPELTIANYGQNRIKIWADHYNKILEKAKMTAKGSTPTSTSSTTSSAVSSEDDLFEKCVESRSSSPCLDTIIGQKARRVTLPVSDSSRDTPANSSCTTTAKDPQTPPTSSQIHESSHNPRNASSSASSSPRDMSLETRATPEKAKEITLADRETRTKLAQLKPRPREPWTPREPVVRRQVYKDELGDYRPILTEEEIAALQHQKYMEERRRRLRPGGGVLLDLGLADY